MSAVVQRDEPPAAEFWYRSSGLSVVLLCGIDRSSHRSGSSTRARHLTAMIAPKIAAWSRRDGVANMTAAIRIDYSSIFRASHRLTASEL